MLQRNPSNRSHEAVATAPSHQNEHNLERAERIASCFGGEGLAEVGVEGAALQPPDLVDREHPRSIVRGAAESGLGTRNRVPTGVGAVVSGRTRRG